MFTLDNKSRKSIYEQIVDGFKEMIVSGELKAGDKLPSVRELSALLTVNPNTIQKAYSALESQGWTYPVTGKGSYVGDKPAELDHTKIGKVTRSIKSLVDELYYLGLTVEQVKELLSTIAEERRLTK